MINKLDHLHQCMRPQFIWDRNGGKLLQTNEQYEGSKDIARMIFVGLADIYGFHAGDIQDYLDMEYGSYRTKLQDFRRNWRYVISCEERGVNDAMAFPMIKFNNKTRLCINAIKWRYNENPYLRIDNWLNYE